MVESSYKRGLTHAPLLKKGKRGKVPQLRKREIASFIIINDVVLKGGDPPLTRKTAAKKRGRNPSVFDDYLEGNLAENMFG